MKDEQKRLDAIYQDLRREVGSSTMDLINELVNLEIEIEQECNN